MLKRNCKSDLFRMFCLFIQPRTKVEVLLCCYPKESTKTMGCYSRTFEGFSICGCHNTNFDSLVYNKQFYNTFWLSRLGLATMCTFPQKEMTCWKCDKTLKILTVFCDSCDSLQPVNKHANLFQILGVKSSYKIEVSELRRRYRQLQAVLHPDKFSSRPQKEQELSVEYSSAVNKAYSTLLDPLERGLYLLSLHNNTIEEESMDEDKMFLMEIMERNEEIENESDPSKLKEFYSNNRQEIVSLIEKVEEAFDSNNVGLAKKLLTKMKYYVSIESKIKEIKQKFNIPD